MDQTGIDTMDAQKRERIRISCACRDSEAIPKVSDAGCVRTSGAARPYQVMHNGIKVYVDSHYGDFNTEVIRGLKGHHEPQEELVFHEVLKRIAPGSVMVELGSFWAYYSMWFHATVPGATNYMVEPIESCLDAGRANFALNGMHGRFLRACVGRQNMAEVAFKHWDGSLVPVRQIAVDTFLDDERIGRLSVLHADVQGAEKAMLEGAPNALGTKRISYIFLSTHTDILHHQCLRILRQHSYGIVAEYAPSESYSVDGLIVASAEKESRLTVRVSKRRSLLGVYRKMKAKLRCLTAWSDEG